jgi:HSP20 family molecular chaperone IbpA
MKKKNENENRENRELTTTTPETAVERTRERRVVQPRCDIFESEEAVTLVADMPGIDESGLDVTLENNVLRIAGRARFEPPAGYSLRWAEFEPVDYERTFVLSERVDADKISATMRNGQLRVAVPRTQPAQRRIAVQVG